MQFKTLLRRQLLSEGQVDALNKIRNGSILCGKVGSGKSRVALAYYLKEMSDYGLVIITTPKKRDSHEWEDECTAFIEAGVDNDDLAPIVDSWNNIAKYTSRDHCFFIFDEQRVVGSGSWSKSFIKITKSNPWILLSATPGDNWFDYIAVFIAHGWFRNRTQFLMAHAVYNRNAKWPRKDVFRNEAPLMRYRDAILVDIPYTPRAKRNYEEIICAYDVTEYKRIRRLRTTPGGAMIDNYSQLISELRKCCCKRTDREGKLMDILAEHPRAIIFYNYDYEWEDLKGILDDFLYEYSSYNGHVHESIPTGDSWCYLVQYLAGAEGWNCTACDTIIFYSQNYSYRIIEQARGRIDRRNTVYENLYYITLRTDSSIDRAIKSAVRNKEMFSERKFYEKL